MIGSAFVILRKRPLLLCLAGNSVWASAPFRRFLLEVNQETRPALFRFSCSAGLRWRTRLSCGFRNCCRIDTSLDDSSVLELDVANRQHNCMLSWRASFRTTILVGRDSKRRNATEPRLRGQMEALPTESGELGRGPFDTACRSQAVAARCRTSQRGAGALNIPGDWCCLEGRQTIAFRVATENTTRRYQN